MARILRLGQRWTIGAKIGGGGFAEVFEAVGENGTAAAAKLVPKAPGAEREMLLVDLAGVRNVVPVVDQGEDGKSWVLVMPRAAKSLRQELASAGSALPVDQAVAVLIDLAGALEDLEHKVVHRDLKPENVLWLDGHWCLADFGIARYADATTATNTWKGAHTAPYAAPEVWRDERATSATDVYSLGVIAYEMLTGRLPFLGPDFRTQHLSQDPPATTLSAPLSSIVVECLYKPAGARPTPANLIARLQKVARPASAAQQQLQAAHQAVVLAQAKATAAASASEQEKQRRDALFVAGAASLGGLANLLREQIQDFAPSARTVVHNRMLLALDLDQASLSITVPVLVSPGEWQHRPPPFDVVARSRIRIHIPAGSDGYEGRSHSLWFCDGNTAGTYRWFETAFMHGVFSQRMSAEEPFALDPSPEAGSAIGRGIAPWAIAWSPTPIDQGEHEEFVERWMTWFANASLRRMSHPSSMPERNGRGFRE